MMLSFSSILSYINNQVQKTSKSIQQQKKYLLKMKVTFNVEFYLFDFKLKEFKFCLLLNIILSFPSQ